jgi:hypothetical protein
LAELPDLPDLGRRLVFGLLFHREVQDRGRPTGGKFARVAPARSPIGKAGERGQRNERDRGHDRANARLVFPLKNSFRIKAVVAFPWKCTLETSTAGKSSS